MYVYRCHSGLLHCHWAVVFGANIKGVTLEYSISQKICVFCFTVLCCGYAWTGFPYPSGLLYWHCGNLTIAPVPAKQPWWMWINTSCEFIINDCITTTKQSTTKPCAYFLGYTVPNQNEAWWHVHHVHTSWAIQYKITVIVKWLPWMEIMTGWLWRT